MPKKETCGKLTIMTAHRIEQTVQRIETALGRIADLADRINAGSPPVADLAVKHEKLRETVSNSLKQLDDVLERLEK